MRTVEKNENFGLIKTLVDAHTMGIRAISSLLCECGYRVFISPYSIEYAIERITVDSSQNKILEWIDEHNISRIGFSYRLDEKSACNLLGRLVHLLTTYGYYGHDGAKIKGIFFSGLISACKVIEKEYRGGIVTFCGGETPEETLLTVGIPPERIHSQIINGCKYDKALTDFGMNFIKDSDYTKIEIPKIRMYPEFGTMKDTLDLRLNNKASGEPIIRAHLGPYSDGISRIDCLKKYNNWCRQMGKSGMLDVLSIGSSQLSQSNFGECWDDKFNGGGVPVNSEAEYKEIWKSSRPMLVRTYSGTNKVRKMAEIYEKTINISWHALSLWWFNELDGRGALSLYDGLKAHIETIRYIATIGKPFEANVSHHFAFRGADDVTYIISCVLAAKLAKKCGIKLFVLQNMLNTPRSTWGVQDLAKGRTLLKLAKELEDDNFHVLLQTRAGLDYFKPDLETARGQLAATTALMDDIEPVNEKSPAIIHVVSYSEALFLATPDVLIDSIKITLSALWKYRNLKKQGLTMDVMTDDIVNRQMELEQSCRAIIKAMEDNIPDLYSPEGLYVAFVAGWLPVPDLWSDSTEFVHAKGWETRMYHGGMVLFDQNMLANSDYRINRCISNLRNANYIFKHKHSRNL